MAKKAKVVKEKSIEDRIWDSANKLRGNLTASEYQNVVLGLVFLGCQSQSVSVPLEPRLVLCEGCQRRNLSCNKLHRYAVD